MRKILFIGIVFLFLFSACTTLETPATTFTPKTYNPTPLQETIEVTAGTTPTSALEPILPFPTPGATLAIMLSPTIDNQTKTLSSYLNQVEGLKLAALVIEQAIAVLSCCAT